MKKNKNIEKVVKVIENVDFVHIGETLKQLRILSNIKYADLARASGKINGTIFAQIENGQSISPRYENLQVYAQVLGVPLSFILLIHESKSAAEKNELWESAKTKVLERCANQNKGKCKLEDNCVCRKAD